MGVSDRIKSELGKHAEPAKAKFLKGYFQAFAGGYGEGDRFLGVRVPNQRKTAARFEGEATLEDVDVLLSSAYHEHRLTALFILVRKYERAKDEGERGRIARFYLSHLGRVNNWDLVDSSAEKILGAHLADGNRDVLYELASSGDLWKQRAAVIAAFRFIRRGEFDDALRLAGMLLDHRHELIHKAVGWMLREIGKRDRTVEEHFLKRHAARMPRTALRYALEKFEPSARSAYMRGERDADLHC